MESLFPDYNRYPDGFLYHPDFLSIAEEEQIISTISNLQLHTFTFQGYEAKRKVVSYGYDYNFDNRTITKGLPIPIDFDFLINKVCVFLSLERNAFAELLVTEYPEGSVINWHRDAPPFDIIVGVSLASVCKFRLRPHLKDRQTKSSIISVPIKRRSLYVLKGAARSEWQHSISPVTNKRYSITLRTIR